jgi:hypothetical protein
MAMTNAEAIRHLKRLRDRLEELRKGIKRKHWKPSEKAMTMASYQLEIDAVSKALICMAAQELKQGRSGNELV